jgi:hypothetical protein
MKEATEKVGLPPALLSEIGRIAEAENRPAGELLADMVSGYLKGQRWQKLVGEAKARGQGLRPQDIEATVNTAIADYRQEHGR